MKQQQHNHKRRRLGETALHTTTSTTTSFTPVTIMCGDLVVLPHQLLQPGFIHINNTTGLILKISSTPPRTTTTNIKMLRTPIIIPGHVDIHNHGVGGANDVIDYWNNPQYTLNRLARSGTTSVIATVVFPDNETSRSTNTCKSISECVNQDGYGCVVRGIHAEGPIVATLGGLPDSSNQAESDNIKDFDHLLTNVIGEHLKIMTISPSIDVKLNYARMKMLTERHIKVSLGHDKNCTEQDIVGALRAVQSSVNDTVKVEQEESSFNYRRCHMTHVFNVQQFHHRNSGLANFALIKSFPNMPMYQNLLPPTVEVIGDFKHVSPLTLKALFSSRNTMSDVCVITDAIAEATPGKRIQYSNDRLAEVSSDGQTVNIAGTNLLCGSCTSLHSTFRRLVDVLNIPLLEAVHICSTTPSQIVGIGNVVGSLVVGKRADLLLLDVNLNVLKTVVGGKIVWDCESPMEVVV